MECRPCINELSDAEQHNTNATLEEIRSILLAVPDCWPVINYLLKHLDKTALI